jgi:hypothetical protein
LRATVKNVSCNVSWKIDWQRRFIPWPHSSSSFTPPHFFSCGLVKNYVCMCKNNSLCWPICKNPRTRWTSVTTYGEQCIASSRVSIWNTHSS